MKLSVLIATIAAVTLYSPAQADAYNRNETRLLQASPRGELPCSLKPTLDFLGGSNGFFTHEQLASAAWFARAVQLPDEEREAHWKSLDVAPLSVRDLYAGPFGLHATVLEFDHDVLVLYRGTQDALDYILNGAFYTTPGVFHGLPGWVHAGFLMNFKLTTRKLLSTLKGFSRLGKRVSFSAHSLGGVLSQYAAWRAVRAGVQVGRVYAFQSPNAGDATFKKRYDQRFDGRSINVLYGDDLTPHIPPPRASAQVFAEASTRPLAGLLKGIVRMANYSPLAGRFSISEQGILSEIPESDLIETEAEYWGRYRQLTGGVGFPRGLGKTSKIVRDHNITQVTCALARNIQ